LFDKLEFDELEFNELEFNELGFDEMLFDECRLHHMYRCSAVFIPIFLKQLGF
jgi:hypothetical protein